MCGLHQFFLTAPTKIHRNDGFLQPTVARVDLGQLLHDDDIWKSIVDGKDISSSSPSCSIDNQNPFNGVYHI